MSCTPFCGSVREGPAPGNLDDWVAGRDAFEALTAWWTASATLRGRDGSAPVTGVQVTRGFFEVFRRAPLLGRRDQNVAEIVGGHARFRRSGPGNAASRDEHPRAVDRSAVDGVLQLDVLIAVAVRSHVAERREAREQIRAHVLDRDHRLIGEGFEELDLRWSKRAYLDATCDQCADKVPLLTKWNE